MDNDNRDVYRLLKDMEGLGGCLHQHLAKAMPYMAEFTRLVKSLDLKAYMRLLGRYVKEHPYRTAFIVLAIALGITIAANPLALAGFGALGPIAGR